MDFVELVIPQHARRVSVDRTENARCQDPIREQSAQVYGGQEIEVCGISHGDESLAGGPPAICGGPDPDQI